MRIITEILKGVTGNYEINRVVGALGSLAYIVCANAFVIWDLGWGSKSFNVVAYCAAFPTGLGVAVGSIAGAVALKDKSVAKARATENAVPVEGQP